MQRKEGQRHAENQRRVHIALDLRTLPEREEQRDQRVKDKEEDEEGFDGGEVLRLVRCDAPGCPHAEGEEEAYPVQIAPRLEPGNREDAQVDQRVVAKETDMIAPLGLRQDRRGEGPHHGQKGQHCGVVEERQRHTGHAQPHKDGKGQRSGQHVVEPMGGKDRQIEDADTAAL